ncbi:Rieske 2Fe-2S domain-containing protein [Pseudonocardia endophytica]|uniref:Toluene monooxygenase system ferredoxin subunit n=1 Tax=Pseudonocardia endophytica TaxID=401976 RepID=A0A4R1HXU4_PSEEN|nr:Rieske 2Fe-2S domain-containing protein [Pseudonocardia endophytica]TCK27624.1 toluene monooxygenase system ferredoxin subunit [Pseudonocardia endophytica]
MNRAASGTSTWTAAMEEDELWEGDMAPVVVNGVKVLLMNVDGTVRAYQNRCPHQEWALDEGEFDEGKLICSRHLWEFDALTGAGVNPTDCALTSYPVKVEDGQILVSLP